MSEIAISTLFVAVGLTMLYFGAKWLVGGSVDIAKKLRISQLVVGLTIVAFGTSTPELSVSITAALKGHADISLGNVVGSNIANIGLILGLSAIILPLLVNKTTIKKEIPIMIAVALLLIPLSMDGKISQIEGVVMISSLVAFTYFTYTQARKENQTTYLSDEEIDYVRKKVYLKSGLLVGIGISLQFFGSFLTVDNAVVIAKNLGISERVIGLTIVAIGTSLPELITSILAALKRHADISIGNIVGSNIYNILAIVGISSALSGITVNTAMFTDYFIMIAFSLVLLPITRTHFIISRVEGYGLVGGYLTYLILLFMLSKKILI